ncbi:ser/thr kinase [Thraustotheca clavata]|uniref:Ser/thr kinase n=1 Tax=Thraustotheca clavata TaxID=74557 RepID=A0A1W0AAG6_9STRA|nr:ser/thr kinase [Thraustotheca clavata]
MSAKLTQEFLALSCENINSEPSFRLARNTVTSTEWGTALIDRSHLQSLTHVFSSVFHLKCQFILTLSKSKLRECNEILRGMHADGVGIDDIREEKNEMMQIIHRIMIIHLGTPPTKFDFSVHDKEKNHVYFPELTPQEFYAKHVDVKVSNMVSIANGPRHDYNITVTVDKLGNVVGGKRRTIDNDLPVWFGCDVGKSSSRKLGIMSTKLYYFHLAYGTTLSQSKAGRLTHKQSQMTHAMLGPDRSDHGFDIMTSEWIDEYMYQVVVDKDSLTPEHLELLEANDPPWDPMGKRRFIQQVLSKLGQADVSDDHDYSILRDRHLDLVRDIEELLLQMKSFVANLVALGHGCSNLGNGMASIRNTVVSESNNRCNSSSSLQLGDAKHFSVAMAKIDTKARTIAGNLLSTSMVASLQKSLNELNQLKKEMEDREKLKLDYDSARRKLQKARELHQAQDILRRDAKLKHAQEALATATQAIMKKMGHFERLRPTLFQAELEEFRSLQMSFFQICAESFGASPQAFNIDMTRKERNVGGHYQLGLEIGKGGFGTVYNALDLRNGKSVAIKQVSLIDMAKEELAAIESEISLLKKLHHENIVKYYNTIKEDDYLYIILEYMENGSLAQFMKKFGTLSETLVAMYITQVLRGLAYLHAQGVLHRDVKGANILTTKDGLVKIADFGVAIKLNEAQKSNSVVGSPYWMAPEVIEMAGWSSASDIWSVGCTIIELLTQKPPYFDLAPMAALFRIVQDDHPPLPKNISPALNDFIMKCFNKEPRLRLSAEQLLQHPWISQIPRNKVEQSTQEVQENVTSTDDRKAVLNTIRMYDSYTRDSSQSALESMKEDDDDENWDNDIEDSSIPLRLPTTTSKSTPDTTAVHLRTGPAKAESKGQITPSKFQLSHDDASDPFWNDEDDTQKAPQQPSSTWDSVLGENDTSKLDKFREDKVDMHDGLEPAKDGSNLRIRLSSSLPDENSMEGLPENPFDDPLFDTSARDTTYKTTARVVELLSLLDPSMEDRVVLDSCEQLHELCHENPGLRQELVSQAGVMPNIMEALEMKTTKVLLAVLKVVNMLIVDNKKFLENLALVGLIPVVVKLVAKHPLDESPRTVDTSKQVRLEAAKFVQQSCTTSSLTLQMFIACGGLPILIDFLSVHELDLQRIAIQGIVSVFTLQTIPKNDTCRLFVKVGLLRRLILVYNQMILTIVKEFKAVTSFTYLWDELHKVCDILLLFSQGDVVVKEHMCEMVVLEGLLYSLNPGDDVAHDNNYASAIVKVLKCIRNLSMEPNTLENLDRAGTIPTLVHVLHDETSPQIRDIQNVVLHAMFYLCRINRNRQTHAAQAGLIPFLQQVTLTRNPLKQFVLPIICDMAHASTTAREHLWACDGVQFFLTLLSDKFWQIDALKAIATWLVHDTVNVESVLLAPEHIELIVNCFRTADEQFENLLESLLEILSRSVRMNQALGRSSLFVMEILYRLSYPKPFVRKNLLKMLKSIFESHTAPVQFLIEYNLHPTIHALAQENNQILIQEIASQLLQAILVTAAVF